MNKKLLLGFGLALALIGLGVASYYSPLWTMRQLYQAAKLKEVDRLSDYVDFDAMRENFKAIVMTEIDRSMEELGDTDNPFIQFGKALAVTMVNPMVDTMVSPAALASLVSRGELPEPGKQTDAVLEDDKQVKFGIDYTAWDRVKLTRTDMPDGPFMILRREGLWSWKLVNVIAPKMQKLKALQ